MEKYTYCLVNGWVFSSQPGRHIYVRFPYKLNEFKVHALQTELEEARISFIDDEEATPYDIVQEALAVMKDKFNVKGTIVDGCDLIMF